MFKPLGKASGVSMIEVVVTILVMSVGLLGLAGLQSSALKFQKTSGQRAEAMQAAYDISERMRANGKGVQANNYVRVAPYASTGGSYPAVPTCTGTPCTASDIANIDIAEWQRSLTARLTTGGGYISPNGNGTFDVTVMWKEPTLTAVDPACPSGTPPAPGSGVRCFVVRFTP